MYPLVHSPTQTTFKSKWNTFKEWFTPDLSKRRPSQCSTTSTSTTLTNSTTVSNCCCNNKEEFMPTHKKRPSLTTSIINEGVLDKCMSPFRRRPSNASHQTLEEEEEDQSLLRLQQQTKIEKLYELYNFAIDEINYAEDSQGSPYYHGDKIAAKEAIDHCHTSYQQVLSSFNLDNSNNVLDAIGSKIATLSTKFNQLPADDQLSI
ncbi:unnamed protein product [Mucor hiemalis]